MNKDSVRIRFAEASDAEALLGIYAPYIEETAITFETSVPSLNEFQGRMRGIMEAHPYLVAVEHGRIIGYAYAHRSHERAAYQWNAELSVYLAPDCRGRGLGRALAKAVLDMLELQGVRNVFSRIAIPNDASVRMHQALGFRHIGTEYRAGYKLGAWRDVGLFQKQLGCFEGEPERVLGISEALAGTGRPMPAEAE